MDLRLWMLVVHHFRHRAGLGPFETSSGIRNKPEDPGRVGSTQ